MTTLRQQIEQAEVRGQKSEVGRRPTSVLRPPISGRKDLRGCSGCRKKMLAKMKAKRRGPQITQMSQMTTDKEPHT